MNSIFDRIDEAVPVLALRAAFGSLSRWRSAHTMAGISGLPEGRNSRRELLKGLLGCVLAPVCAELPVEPVALPGVFKFRQKGASLLIGKWMSEKRAEEVRQMWRDGHPGPFVQVYDLTPGQMYLVKAVAED